VTSIASESATSTTEVAPTTIPAPAALVSGEWVAFGADAGLPGTPTDTIAVDDSGGVWVLAHTDDPTTAQLYSLDVGDRTFVARGEPLVLTAEWYTLWMEAPPTGVAVALEEYDASAVLTQRLWQWDDAGWHDLATEHDLPRVDPSIAQRLPDGGLRVAGYTAGAGPMIIDITDDGVAYVLAPEGAWGGGRPSPFTVRAAVIPVGPDGRSWFMDGIESIAALDAGGYEVYTADADCCYVPLAADETGIWASLGSHLYRYDVDGWRAVTSSVPMATDDPRSIVTTADGDIWLLGRSGVARFDPDNIDGVARDGWTVFTISEAEAVGVPLVSGQTRVLNEGDAVWLASWGNGLSLWLHDGHKWAEINVPDFLNQEDTGFMQNTVTARNGSLWVATSTGVARFKPAP
jgi:hypothetical protein